MRSIPTSTRWSSRADAEFQRTSTGRDEDRVYILQFKAQEDRRFFFWMQDADDDSNGAIEKLSPLLNGA